MTRSSRPRLRSVISRGDSHDDLSEGTSARTRPLSYDEIMDRRKNKKRFDDSKEEARETEPSGREETVKNLDDHGRNSSAAAMKHSRNHGREGSYRKKEEKSTRLDDTYSKSKNRGNHDMESQSKQKHEKDMRNDKEAVKTFRGGHERGKLDEENQVMDRSKHNQDKDVKSGTEVSKADRRGHISGRIDEESRGMNTRSNDKYDKNVKYSTEVSKVDRRGHLSGVIDEESRGMNTRSKDNSDKDAKNITKVSKADRRGHLSDAIDEESRGMNTRSKDNSDRDVKNITEVSKADRRGHLSCTIDEESRGMNTRSKDRHDKDVKNGTEVTKTDRREYVSRRIDDSHVTHVRNTSSKDKHVKSENISTPSSKGDKLENVRDKQDEKSHDVDSRSKNKHEKDGRNSNEELMNPRQGPVRSKQGEILRDAAKFDCEDRSHRYMERSGGASEREKKRKVLDEKYKSRDPVKKHDNGSRRDSDISERKEKMDFSHSRNDDSRSKRRRSRSQERYRDKDRRSRSASPKARKNKLSSEHDQGAVSLHSQKERSRHDPDLDRINIPNNGLTGHHRRHSGFSSGLGGYSPRKRKTDAAVKTPSPIHSPERKSGGGNLPSSGVDKNLSASVPSVSQLITQSMLSNKISPATGTSVPSSIMPLSTLFYQSLSTLKEASVDSVQLTQATRPMRRLYIDNIPASASEKEIMESFNTYLLSSGSNHIRGTRPCLSCMIHKEKGQALLEFLTPEDASAALSFDGRSLYGSVLKIRRPKDYVEMTSGSGERLKAEAGKQIATRAVASSDVEKDVKISDVVKDSPHKIFIGGIAEGISSELIMEIVSVLGPLKAFHFDFNEIVNEPCVFLEYTDHSITSKACAALNGMKLGGRILTVAQAFPDPSFKENSETQPFYGIPEHVKPLLETPTRVLKLSNLLDQKAVEVLPELDLEDLMEDVRLECSRFGSVVSINIVKTSILRTAISEAKEVVSEELPLQPYRESDHDTNMSLVETATEYDEGEGNGKELLTNVEDDLNKMDSVEGGDLATATAIEVEPSNISMLEVKETDITALPKYDDEAVIGSHESLMMRDSTVENTKSCDSDGNHQEPMEEGGVSSIRKPKEDIGDFGVVKVDDSEPSAEDVEELDKAIGKPQEVVSVSNDSQSNDQGPKSGVENESASDVGDKFEVGCILVEFRRTEASCMAAHSLHGRLFDDRIVTVEYVALSAYQTRFPKRVSGNT